MMDPKMMQDNESTEPTPDSETGPGEPPKGAEAKGGKGDLNLDEEPANVTPEEQKQYDTVVVKAMELLYDPQRLPVMLEKLKANTDNISAEIGHSAAMTLLTISRTVENQGQQIPEEILYAAGQEIVSQITDIAEAAAIIKQADAEKIAEAALYEGLRVWGQQMGKSGQIDDAKSTQAADLLRQAGIEQDTSKAPGHGPQAEPGVPNEQQGMTGPAAQPPGPPQQGIVNQAMGAPQ